MKRYEKYKLKWMIDHGYSLEDLVNRLADIINAELNVNTNAHTILDEAFEILEYEQGFKESEIWACEDEWKDLDDDEIDVKYLILEGIRNDIVKFIKNPNDDCIVCSIGDYWFYFIGDLDEHIEPSELMKSFTCDELTDLIYTVMIYLDEYEYNYYISYLEEELENCGCIKF